MKLGKAVRKNGNWEIIKTVDLELINIQLQENIQAYDKLSSIVEKVSDLRKETMGLNRQVMFLMNLVKERLSQIISFPRVKRGLLNPLGSLIKLISGNLDYEDAQRYDSLIKKLDSRGFSVEHKVSLITKALDKMVNASSDMNFNIKYINHKTKTIETENTQHNNNC